MTPTKTQVLAFRALFGGRRDGWGRLEGGLVREAVTYDHFYRHLAGEVSLGIYPLVDDLCYFAAVDIDAPRLELALRVKARLYQWNIPSHIALSRSGNYHVYLFSDSHFNAAFIRKILYHCLKSVGLWHNDPQTVKALLAQEGLGHPPEVFPKQDDSRHTPGGFGNYINLPCFGDQRPFVDSRGNPVTLDYFLENVRTVSNRFNLPRDAVEAVIGLP